jgi:transcriptional regulator with PAS, ATPase and Fis domain
MFLVKRNRFLLFSLFITGCLLGIGIYGYVLVTHSAGYSQKEAVFFAERLLFLSIIFTAGHLFLVFGIIVNSIRVDKELDKIIQLNKYQDFSPKRNMEKLGKLGERITTLYNQLNQLNAYKTQKIGSLSSLSTFLVNNIELPLLITDISGSIVQASSSLAKKLGKKRAEIVGKDFGQIIKEIPFNNLLFELSKLNSSVEKKTSENTYTCYPIHNNRAEIAYIIFVLEKKAVYQALPEEANKITKEAKSRKKGRSLKGALSRFFNTKR